MSSLLGVAYVDIRARLTNFENGLRAGVQRELAGTAAAFNTGGAGVNRAAADMEAGLKSRLAGFTKRTGLADLGAHVSRSASAIGIPLKVALPAALAITGIAAVKMAGTFQSQMNLLVTAAGEAQGAISGMGNQVKQIARDTGTSTSQLTSGLYSLEKAGYRGAAATHVLGIASEGARAEGANLAVVVNGLTSFMASYHIPAGSATKAMNEIIAAAGESKTTMENFANSLSTVIPIASAAHIAFSEVGGAIATLTQHGTSAAEATQELSSLIRNLQAPNQVAQRAMQQLGIGVNSLEQGLSNPRIGLQGTLQRIITTLGHHMGPAGLIAVDAFKKSQSAGQDLTTMLDHMSPGLRKISQGFLDGNVHMKDYRKAFRDLGATGAAQGSQFSALALQSRGFNDLLKSGQPGMQTYVAALKTLTGGAIGLNTALQITGHNMPGLIERTKRIAEASKIGGDHIMTWSKVQQSFNVEMGRLHQVIDTAFISLGQKLLPAVSRAATATFNWFQHLHDGGSVFADTQKKFGPLAGAVDLLHRAFVVGADFMVHSFYPALLIVVRALEPVGRALVRAAEAAMHFANDALSAIGHFLTSVVGPALVSGARYFERHGAAISHDIIVVGQFILILAGVGVAIKLYESALVAAAATTGVFTGVLTFLSLAFTALKTGDIVAFVALYTESTIAATVATGAQAVVTGVVTVATVLWGVAMGVLDGAMAFLTTGSIIAAIRAFTVTSGLATVATWLWTAAQTALDVAMDANPIGLLVIAIVGLIVVITTVITHFENLKHTLGDVFGSLGDMVGNVMGVLHGFVNLVVGLFTLDASKLIDGLEQIGKSILELPLHALEGLGKGLLDLVGIHFGGEKVAPIVITMDTSSVSKASDIARVELDKLAREFAALNNAIDHTSLGSFTDMTDKATAKLKDQAKVFDDLKKTVGGKSVTVGAMWLPTDSAQTEKAIGGVTTTTKQWALALRDAHGNETRALALMKELPNAAGMYKRELALIATHQKNFNTAIKTTSLDLGISEDSVKQYGAFMAITGGQVGRSAAAGKDFERQVANARITVTNAHGAIGEFISGLFTYQNSAKGAADQTNLFKTALDALSGNSQDVRTAIAQANTQVNDLSSSLQGIVGKGKHAGDALFTLGGHAIKLKGSGAQLQTGMAQVKTQLENVAAATLANGGSWKDAVKAYDAAVANTLPQLQKKLHLSGTEVATLNSFLALTPKAKAILLSTPGLTKSNDGMQMLLDKIALYKDKSVTINTKFITTGRPASRSGASASANGNIFPGVRAFGSGGFEDHVAQIAPAGAWRVWAEDETGGEGYIPLGSSKRGRSESLMGQIAKIFGGAYLPARMLKMFADGGITTTTVDGKKKWVYGGIQYASLSAAQNARTRANKKDAGSLVSTVGTSISKIGSAAPSPQIDLTTTTITHVRAQLKAATDALNKAISEGLSAKKADPLRARIAALAKEAQHALGALKITIKTTDAKNLQDQIHTLFTSANAIAHLTAADMNAAFKQMITDAEHAGIAANSRLIKNLRHENTTLIADVAKRNGIAKQLGKANQALAAVQQNYAQEQSTVQSALSSAFNITTAGNFNGFTNLNAIMAGLQTQATSVTDFSANIAKLSKTKIDPKLLAQLSEAGPASNSTVQALLTATPAQVAQINKMQATVNKAAKVAAKTTADALYGAGVKSAQGLVDGLKSQEHNLEKTMKHLADTMVNQIKKDLKIKSPSVVFRHFGRMGGAGLVGGLTDFVPHVKAAAGALSNAAMMDIHAARGNGGKVSAVGRSGSGGVHITNHITPSPGMNTSTLAQRVSQAQATQIRYGVRVTPVRPTAKVN